MQTVMMVGGCALPLTLAFLVLAAVVAIPVQDESRVHELEQTDVIGPWGEALQESEKMGTELGESISTPQTSEHSKVDKPMTETERDEEVKKTRATFYSKAADASVAVKQAVEAVTVLSQHDALNEDDVAKVDTANYAMQRSLTDAYKVENGRDGFPRFAPESAKDMKAIADVTPHADSGEFGELYDQNMKLKESEEEDRLRDVALAKSSHSDSLTPKQAALLYTPAELEELRNSEDVYHRYQESDHDFNPKHSKHYNSAQEQHETEKTLLDLLKLEGHRFLLEKEAHPELIYVEWVKKEAPVLKGVVNFYAMTDAEASAHAVEHVSEGDRSKDLEKKLEDQEETYLNNFHLLERDIPLTDFLKQETIDRQVGEVVEDPEAVPEEVIASEAEQLYKIEHNSSVAEDIVKVRQVEEEEAAHHDKALATFMSEAQATEKSQEEMVQEGIVGAAQIVKDNELANAELAKEVKDPKPPDTIYDFDSFTHEPDLGEIKYHESELVQKAAHRQNRVAYMAQLRDAEKLAESGRIEDEEEMDQNKKEIEENGVSMGHEQRKMVRDAARWHQRVLKRSGAKIADMQREGVESGAEREIAYAKLASDDEAHYIDRNEAIGPEIGDMALDFIPSDAQSPLLIDGENHNFNGNVHASTPLHRDIVDDGTGDDDDSVHEFSTEMDDDEEGDHIHADTITADEKSDDIEPTHLSLSSGIEHEVTEPLAPPLLTQTISDVTKAAASVAGNAN